jgi:hypothetical protein
MIRDETIKEFQKVVEDEYNVQLTYEEAISILKNWVDYFDLLSKIDHREKTSI